MNNSYYKFGSTKNPYGLKDDKLVFVDDVENGLNCGCVCPTCKVNLIAKQGDIREHHFAHQCDENSCLHIQDTYFRLTQDILEQKRCIMLPAYGNIASKKVSINKVWTQIISDDNKVLPEIIVETEDGMEIHIRYKRKRRYKEDMYIYYLVYLELNAENVSFEQLEDFIINSTANKKWISNPVYDQKIQEKQQSDRDEFLKHYDVQLFDAQDKIIKETSESEKSDLKNIHKQYYVNKYLESGTEQQKHIKELLRENEFFGKSIDYCQQCIYHKECIYLIKKFSLGDKEYMICGNKQQYYSNMIKNKYLDFKPINESDAIDEYEAKLCLGKHFTRNTIIVDYIKNNDHIDVKHTDELGTFYETNVRYLDGKYTFTDEKEYFDDKSAIYHKPSF